MAKSQQRRLREATRRFGYSRTFNISPVTTHSVSAGPKLVKRYSTAFSYSENEEIYGKLYNK